MTEKYSISSYSLFPTDQKSKIIAALNILSPTKKIKEATSDFFIKKIIDNYKKFENALAKIGYQKDNIGISLTGHNCLNLNKLTSLLQNQSINIYNVDAPEILGCLNSDIKNDLKKFRIDSIINHRIPYIWLNCRNYQQLEKNTKIIINNCQSITNQKTLRTKSNSLINPRETTILKRILAIYSEIKLAVEIDNNQQQTIDDYLAILAPWQKCYPNRIHISFDTGHIYKHWKNHEPNRFSNITQILDYFLEQKQTITSIEINQVLKNESWHALPWDQNAMIPEINKFIVDCQHKIPNEFQVTFEIYPQYLEKFLENIKYFKQTE